MVDYNRRLEYLEEYMAIYIQLLPYAFDIIKSNQVLKGSRFTKYDIPTFEHFLETYDNPYYSMVGKNWKETICFENDGSVFISPTTNVNGRENNVIGYRYYNYFLSVKYYLSEDFIINENNSNKHLQCFTNFINCKIRQEQTKISWDDVIAKENKLLYKEYKKKHQLNE